MSKGAQNTGSRQKLFIPNEKRPVILQEVSEKEIFMDSIRDASNFLGVTHEVLTSYIRYKSKVVKNKINGKTYLIRTAK